jgi:hypothetical protein
MERSHKIAFASIIVGGVLLFWGVPAFLRSIVAVHKRGTTRELAEWKVQYSGIRSDADAIRTAEVLGYVQIYDVPSDGYRSDPITEAALEAQRKETVDALVEALKTYTKQDFGKDASAWKAAIERNP